MITLERLKLKHGLGIVAAQKEAQVERIEYNMDLLGLGVALVLDGSFTTSKGEFNTRRYPGQSGGTRAIKRQIEFKGNFKTYDEKQDFWETCWLLAQEVKGSDGGSLAKGVKATVVPATDGIGQFGPTDSRWRIDGDEDYGEYPMY